MYTQKTSAYERLLDRTIVPNRQYFHRGHDHSAFTLDTKWDSIRQTRFGEKTKLSNVFAGHNTITMTEETFNELIEIARLQGAAEAHLEMAQHLDEAVNWDLELEDDFT